MKAQTDDDQLTDNQQKFIDDARRQGHRVDFDYSGRGMFGATCPAVRLDSIHEFNTSAAVHTDNMGLGYVVYARR